jgi:AAA15 family ATPase/GTPase
MENGRIESISIDGVGPFANFKIDFPYKGNENEAEVHIFTGLNGSGKSTLLYCLGVGKSDLIRQRISQKIGCQIGIRTFLGGVHGVSTYKFQSDESGSGGSDFLFAQDNDYYYINEPFRKEHRLSFAMFAYSSYRKIDSETITTIEEITDNPLYGAMSFASTPQSKNFINWIANTKTKEALASKENQNADSAKFASAIDKITDAIFEITGFKIAFELTYKPILKVIVKVEDEEVDFGTLPDGLKSIISWIADLLMRMDRIPWVNDLDIFERNFVLLLDEIEVHLHPAWQRKILPVIKKLFKNAQIFVTTHSPFVVGSVDGAWIYKMKKENTKTALAEQPKFSEDGESFRLILDEIFGIKELFGVGVQKDLDSFYQMKKKILNDEMSLEGAEFQSLAESLMIQSKELETIIGAELRQLNRLKPQTVL